MTPERERSSSGRSIRRGAEQAALDLDTLDSLPIELWPWSMLATRAWELTHTLSSCDASYVALAEMLDAPLLTSDSRIARASGIRCRVEVF